MKLNKDIIEQHIKTKNAIENAVVEIATEATGIEMVAENVWINEYHKEICIDYWIDNEPMQYQISFDDPRLTEKDWEE